MPNGVDFSFLCYCKFKVLRAHVQQTDHMSHIAHLYYMTWSAKYEQGRAPG